MIKYATSVLAVAAALFVNLSVNAGEPGAAGASLLSASAATGLRPIRKPHPAGISEYRLVSGGRERRYLLYVPQGYEGRSALPVVIDFHGSGSDPREEMTVSGMDRAADRRGFVLVMPYAAVELEGGGYTWNVPPDARLPDDVLLTVEVLEHAAARVRIDKARVYVAGFSGGARLASELACAIPEHVAAVGAVGGLRAPPACAGRPVPVIAFHGTGDPINPYAGGGSEYWGYGVDAAVRGWVEHNGCAAGVAETRLSPAVVERRYRGCVAAAEVVLYRIEGGGHTWPGSAYPFPEERFGRTERALDATARMLDFFAGRTVFGGRGARAASRQ